MDGKRGQKSTEENTLKRNIYAWLRVDIGANKPDFDCSDKTIVVKSQ